MAEHQEASSSAADESGAPDASQSTVLTIDLGTSGPKVAVFDAAGVFVDGDFEPVAIDLGDGGKAEQSPQLWWDGVVAGCARLRERGSLDERVIAVSVTSQWSGTVPCDAELKPVHDAIIWMDSRGAADIRERFGGPAAGYAPVKLRTFLRLTGGAPSLSGKDPLAHILWFERVHPDLARRTRWYLEPKDWLNGQLTGRAVATFDSIVLHWLTDNRKPDRVAYAPELLAAAGVDRGKLPELVPATSVVGEVTEAAAYALGVSVGTPVVGGTPDVQSAAIGSGAVRDYEGHLYLGTSSWLTCHVPFKKTDLLSGVASLPAPLPGRFFVANEQEVAGGTLNWLRDQVLYPGDDLDDETAPADVFARIDRLAATSPPGANSVIFTPWLNGERTPVDDHLCRAGWHNMSLRTNRADMVRSVLEGVAFNSRWLMGCVEKFTGREFPWLHLIGGGASSALWCQIHADVLNREIRQVENPIRANARGAALLALLALGRVDVDAIAAGTTISAVYYPDPDRRAVYDRMYNEFRRIYKRNKPVWKALNGHES